VKVILSMSERVSAGKVEDISPGIPIKVHTEDDVICVHMVDGEFHAISNICPHAHAPLDQGFIENGRITCPWHGWSFPLSCEYSDRDGVYRYKVIQEDGELFIEIPAVNA
jgi:nitrite reductase (NADH) small subunit